MLTKKKFRPVLIIAIMFLLFAVAWAVDQLSGQANKVAADSASISASMEMANLESIKPSANAPNCNWSLESSLRKQLQSQDASYNNVIKQAQQEIASQGKVGNSTASQLMAAAEKFKALSDQYGRMWEDCNCTTRAKVAYETGNSRMASAKVVAYGADSDNADALEEAQERMNEARQAYVKEAIENNELSDSDKANLQASLLPKAQALVTETAALGQATIKLLDDVRARISPSGIVGGMSGCLSSGGSQNSDPAADEASALLAPVTGLASLAKGLASSAGSLLEDIVLLVK